MSAIWFVDPVTRIAPWRARRPFAGEAAPAEEMLATGIRDIEHVPAGSREAFSGYFQTVHAALMAGRRERGRTRLRVAGAIGHAINFHTWHCLVREQQLSVDEAITLMTATVQAAGQPTPGRPRQPRSATERSRSSAHARAK